MKIKDEGMSVAGFREKQAFDKSVYFDAIGRSVQKTDRNLLRFGTGFPAPATVDNHYGLNRTYPENGSGQMEETGANTGWTTGFWTGILWLLNEYSLIGRYDDTLKEHIDSFLHRAAEKIDCAHHDMGFLYTLSCVAAYKVKGDLKARKAALMAADILMERYIAKAGIIQAWGNMADPGERGRMIIDSLMNLPLLYWASEATDEPVYRTSAYHHALNAVNNIIREDATTYHTFYFDADTGEPLRGRTKQGHSDESCWARGQAWGIYGFILSYIYTKDPDFLTAAKKLANYFIKRSPEDLVVYWDLDFGDGSGQEKDSSSTAIVVCGLLEMVRHLTDPAEKTYYFNAANAMLQSLCLNYSTREDDGADGLILHGVYYKAGNEGVDEANLWGDYFYLEALIRSVTDWRPYW
ncbi:MAG: glycoside hydrolase family 88 protein [Saccharofermentanales bacterium]